ncbi:MAG: TIGR03618 family F420-dependent PPOX class oxidoreductase [Chloroflexota bacterium]
MSATTGSPPWQPIPATHIDLLQRPVCGVLTTLDAHGGPRSRLVWVDTDGEHALVAITLERLSGRDVTRDPRVSLLVVDPDDAGRFLQVRGDMELVVDGALDHLDRLTRRFTTHPRFYGFVHPEERCTRETRVIGRIRARRVTLDAIHA